MKRITRREFIRIGGMTAAGMSLAGCGLTDMSWNVFGGGSRLDPRFGFGKDFEVVPTSCQVCYWGCGIHAYRTGGGVWKLLGNPNDPLCAGRLCPRGTAGVGLLYDEDRLKTPLLRTENGSGQRFEGISWDAALDTAAERLGNVIADYGPEGVAVITHGKPGHFFEHLVRAAGSPNYSFPSFSLCRGARDVAYWLTYGKDLGSPEPTDYENAKVLVLMGYHLGENMHTTQVREFASFVRRANDGDAKLVVVDPRFSIAAGKAWKWLPIRPVTDMALLLSWIHVLVHEQPEGKPLYNVEYVERYAGGFEELKESVAPYTPEWAWPITGIEPVEIRAVAHELARHAPNVLVHPGRFSSWDGQDTQRSRANAVLNALLGAWGHRGGFFVSDRPSIPRYPHPPYPNPERESCDSGEYPLAGMPSVDNIIKTIASEEPYPIKALVVCGANILSCLPRPRDTVAALDNLDFLMVVDTMPVEQTGYADLVLPDCTYLERMDDISVKNFKQNFITVNQPVIDPLYESRPGWWMAREIGRRMGLSDYFDWENIEEYNETRLAQAGLSLKDVTETGIMPLSTGPIFIEDGKELTFSTPSGKIELSSSKLAGFGHYPVPQFTEMPRRPYPGYFYLAFGRSPLMSFSRSQNVEMCAAVDKGDRFWINVDAARMLGVQDGHDYYLENGDGYRTPFKVTAKVTWGIRPDTIYFTHGYGHADKRLSVAFGRGASDAELISDVKTDPVMGASGMRGNFITVVV